jgi:ribosomal protein L40E
VRPCPVCEAPVTGWQCEVCGKQVGPSPATANLSAPLEGLEATQLPSDVLGLAIEPTPGLEPTATDAVPEIPGEPLLGWEVTHAAGGPDVGAGGLADMDTGRAAPEGPPAVAPTVVTCRYCRNAQSSGVFCDRCGMRLPWARPAAVAAPAQDSTERQVCKRCGERSPASMERCGACGALLATEA